MSDLFERAKPAVPSSWPKDYQEQFWRRYPRRVAKIDAMKALDKVRKRGDVDFDQLIAAVDRYAAWLAEPGVWRPSTKHPATWLNRGCWDDELTEDRPRVVTFAQIGFAGALRRH